MIVPVNKSTDLPEENQRALADLFRNANSKDYTGEKGFKQKLIDMCFELGYYRSNKSIFEKEEGQ